MMDDGLLLVRYMYYLLELNMLCDCVTRGCGDHSPSRRPRSGDGEGEVLGSLLELGCCSILIPLREVGGCKSAHVQHSASSEPDCSTARRPANVRVLTQLLI